MSLSARRAWIEIYIIKITEKHPRGSLSARRAWIEIYIGPLIFSVQAVALRKESVDRNTVAEDKRETTRESLSARRAWIEMLLTSCCPRSAVMSLSARRAWIEICWVIPKRRALRVALRKESVDRNCRAIGFSA